MARSDRLFEIIQLLRAAPRPLTADALAVRLEVSKRTVYRDIATLQARQTPIDGAPGIGYMMRAGYDLPPLNFDADEIDALRVGLAMLVRTGDSGLEAAAKSIHQKVDALHGPADWLQVSPWGAPRDDPSKGCVSIASLRSAIRDARKLKLTYRSGEGTDTIRVIRPLALIYHLECVMVAGWCELRTGFRHFRTDRIYECTVLEDRFAEQSGLLRQLWGEENQWGRPRASDEMPKTSPIP
ncbi:MULTISPECIES: helix-turn-helix transcriptional regulator [Roseobacter]|uniref:helix-turn-helix transcriptional regulator n=1 Tax=Roseobacter TaxID=2433 RepID=UPI001BBB4F84|nr:MULTISPECIES: YafY family protein [Roseobacter]GIT85034.1 transcriptional regulator [Roseobacter sp. OBYS 0001]